jgi:hypothetical protein
MNPRGYGNILNDSNQESGAKRNADPREYPLSQVFQQRTLKIVCNRSILQKSEKEAGIIAFLRVFKMPSIDLKFQCFENAPTKEKPLRADCLHRINHQWLLNFSGVTMLLASLDSNDIYYGTIPLSLWPTVLGQKQRKRPARKEKKFMHEDAVFHLLRRCPDLFSQPQAANS